LLSRDWLVKHQVEDAAFCGRSFVFVSDRDKCLKPALKEVFWRNLEFSCAEHIKSNITQRLGKQCGRYVMAIAKTYSARNASNMLDLVRQIKPSAAAYIQTLKTAVCVLNGPIGSTPICPLDTESSPLTQARV
jgi:hypothetical protein